MMKLIVKSWVFMVGVLFITGAALAQPLVGTLQEWNTSPLRPYDIVALDNGSIWMNTSSGNAVFTINRVSGATTAYTAPFIPAQFHTIARGPGDTLWIADGQDRIVHFDPTSGVFTAYPLDGGVFTLPAQPFGINVASDGSVWFTCWTDYCIGRYNPTSGTWQRFAPSPPGVLPDPPDEIAFGADGTIWFTMRRLSGSAGLGHLDPGTGHFDLWINPYPGAIDPFGIIVLNGEIWFLDHHANLLVRFNPASSTFTPYSTAPNLIDPHFLVADYDGTIWMSAFVSGTIGRFNPSTGTFSHVALADPNSHPQGIALSPAGEIWCAETFTFDQGGVARFVLQQTVGVSVPTMTEWGMVIMSILFGGSGIYLLRRRRAV